MVPHVERSCLETCETPLHACIRTTIAQASHAICDILATNIGIVRKACREGKCTTRVPRAADRRRAQAQPAFKGYSLQVILVG
jgi:hypothetical protein